MGLNLFDENSNNDIQAVIQGTDAEKFQKIASTLCVKRKALEERLEKEGASGNDEERLELRNLIEEMKTFGVTEIEYQKWLVSEGKEL